MRTAAVVVLLFTVGPARAELTRPQCKTLSAAMGNTIVVLDKMRGTLDRQAFAEIAKGSSLEDFQAQLDACARR